MTHLVDLVQWEAYPDVILSPADAKVLKARRWTTPITLEQFGRLTGSTEFPAYLAEHVKDGVLQAPANGEFTYTLKGVHARVWWPRSSKLRSVRRHALLGDARYQGSARPSSRVQSRAQPRAVRRAHFVGVRGGS